MLDLRKRLERFSADALRWRIGRDEIRKLRFEINKLLVEPVILAVADDGRGVLVIQSVVLADFLSQLRDVFLGFGSVHRCCPRYDRGKARQRWNALSDAAGLIVASSIFLGSP